MNNKMQRFTIIAIAVILIVFLLFFGVKIINNDFILKSDDNIDVGKKIEPIQSTKPSELPNNSFKPIPSPIQTNLPKHHYVKYFEDFKLTLEPETNLEVEDVDYNHNFNSSTDITGQENYSQQFSYIFEPEIADNAIENFDVKVLAVIKDMYKVTYSYNIESIYYKEVPMPHYEYLDSIKVNKLKTSNIQLPEKNSYKINNAAQGYKNVVNLNCSIELLYKEHTDVDFLDNIINPTEEHMSLYSVNEPINIGNYDVLVKAVSDDNYLFSNGEETYNISIPNALDIEAIEENELVIQCDGPFETPYNSLPSNALINDISTNRVFIDANHNSTYDDGERTIPGTFKWNNINEALKDTKVDAKILFDSDVDFVDDFIIGRSFPSNFVITVLPLTITKQPMLSDSTTVSIPGGTIVTEENYLSIGFDTPIAPEYPNCTALFYGWFIKEDDNTYHYIVGQELNNDITVYGRWYYETGDYRYNNFTDGITITNYLGNDVDVSVPAELPIGNTQESVRKIGSMAFYDNDVIENLSVANTVEIVDNKAFAKCDNLHVVQMDSVLNIEKDIFMESDNITTLSMDSVTTIENGFFSNLDKLVNVSIDSIEILYTSAFYNLTDLVNVSMNSVKQIDSFAFYNCTNLSNLDISSVNYISEYAFYNCQEIEYLDVQSVKTIGDYAFYCCANLEISDMPEVQSLGVNAFRNCNSIVNLNMRNIEEVGMYAFNNCSNLSNVNIESAITLGSSCFDFCEKLSNIKMNSVRNIGGFAFNRCVNLENVDIQNVRTIGASAFQNCIKLKNIDISLVEEIKDYTFYNCNNMLSINMNSVKKIGNGAFYFCEKLGDILLQSKITTIESDAFIFCHSMKNIFIEGKTGPDDFESLAENVFQGKTVYYMLKDVSNVTFSQENYANTLPILNNLPEGITSNLYYEGIDGTIYEKSKTVPVALGKYKVTVEYVGEEINDSGYYYSSRDDETPIEAIYEIL